MTCYDAREWLGALVDEAVDPARRVEVEAHLLACAECRLELEGLRATVGLLRRVEPARAPAGFVDRVMRRARPTPWYRRVAAWLFLPLSVKLPAEAAAIVVIAGLAMLLIDRTPELRQAARVEPPAPPPISDAPPQPAPRGGEVPTAPSAKVAPAPPEPAQAPTAQMERKLSSPSVGRVTGLSARPADVEGRLEVRDRSAAVAALPDLLTKVGGSEAARRQDGADLVVEVLIPEARYDDFARGLEALGTWSAPGPRQRVMPAAPYLRIPIRIAE